LLKGACDSYDSDSPAFWSVAKKNQGNDLLAIL